MIVFDKETLLHVMNFLGFNELEIKRYVGINKAWVHRGIDLPIVRINND